MTNYESTGKTLDEAIRAGLNVMGVERDAVSVEVLEKPKNGFFGLGGTLARVKLTLADTGAVSGADKTAAPASKGASGAKDIQGAKPAPRAQTAPRETAAAAPRSDAPARRDPKPQTPVRQPQAQSAAERRPQAAAPVRARQEGEPRPRAERQSFPATPEQREAALKFVNGLMEQMKTGATATAELDGDGIISVTIDGDNLGGLIGRRGDTLDAIQYLTAHVVNRGSDRPCRVHVDAANYRAKRRETLKRLALRTAENAVRHRNSAVLEPMNAFERHIIHVTLQDFNGVSTYSQGTEPQRRVVVAYQGGAQRTGYAQRPGGDRRRPGGDSQRPGAYRQDSRPRRDDSRPRAQAAPERAAPERTVPVSEPSKRGLPVKEFGIRRDK